MIWAFKVLEMSKAERAESRVEMRMVDFPEDSIGIPVDIDKLDRQAASSVQSSKCGCSQYQSKSASGFGSCVRAFVYKTTVLISLQYM
jgi:hypothetical protein